jgi:hypothetical protein
MTKWLGRIVITIVAASVLLYAGDWLVFKMRGSPQGKVSVSRMAAVPLKGNKTDYEYMGTSDVNCSVSLFPQDGEDPCWHLQSHRTQTVEM